MKQKEKIVLSPFMENVHRVGRIFCIVTIAAFIIAGVLICKHFGYFPTISQFFVAVIGVIILDVSSGVGELLANVPKLGAGAAYISYITGNVMNMKLPSIVATIKALDVKEDSEEYNVLSIIIAVVASFFVVACLGVVVLFADQIRPFLEWEAIQPAINNVIPVLFAVLSAGFARTEKKLTIITAVLLVPIVLYLNPITNSLAGITGGMIIAGALAALFVKKAKRSEEDV